MREIRMREAHGAMRVAGAGAAGGASHAGAAGGASAARREGGADMPAGSASDVGEMGGAACGVNGAGKPAGAHWPSGASGAAGSTGDATDSVAGTHGPSGMPLPLLEVHNLTVRDDAGRAVLDGVNLTLHAGDSLAVVGESGAGKTTLALAVLGRVREGLAVTEGSVRVAGTDVLSLRGRELRDYRRHVTSALSQDPALSLTPSMSVYDQLRETGAFASAGTGSAGTYAAGARALPGRLGRWGGASGFTRERALGLLASVGLSGVDGLLRRRPGSLSGGQRRRVALARAMASRPRLLVLDEPTAGVDPAATREVIDTVLGLQEELGMALLVITHDLSVARRLARDVAVMRAGHVVEAGPCAQVLGAPAQAYTRELVAAERLEEGEQTEAAGGDADVGEGHAEVAGADAGEWPEGHERAEGHVRAAGPEKADTTGDGGMEGKGPGGITSPRQEASTENTSDGVFLRARDLAVTTPDGRAAVRGLSFDLLAGRGVALVGASGAGKTTVVRALTGLRPADAGSLELRAGGRLAPAASDAARRTKGQLLALQVVPQDPATSLNPALSVGLQLTRAVARRHPDWVRARRREEAARLLVRVGLPVDLLSRMPHELSGGQAQRVAVARALAHEPIVLACDEATSALDATTQRDVLLTLRDLRDREGLGLVVVTHDPQVASFLCDETYKVGAQ